MPVKWVLQFTVFGTLVAKEFNTKEEALNYASAKCFGLKFVVYRSL